MKQILELVNFINMPKELNQFVGNVMTIIDIFDFEKPKTPKKNIWLKKVKPTKLEYDINALKK